MTTSAAITATTTTIQFTDVTLGYPQPAARFDIIKNIHHRASTAAP